MVKSIKVRRSGKSLIVTLPLQICELYNIAEGNELELTPFATDAFLMKVKK